MLNINNFLPIKNLQTQKTTPKVQQNPLFSFNAPKLAPLAQDTVSFTGVVEYKAALDNAEVCKALYNNAQPAQEFLENALVDCFAQKYSNGEYKKGEKGEIIYTSGVKTIKGRRKSADSIQEKIADKIEDALNSDHIAEKIFCPSDPGDIKKNVKDIIGTRVVMSNASAEKTGEILSKLADTIKEKGIVIDEIENHSPQNPKIAPYFEKKDLEVLKDAINEVRKKNGLEEINIKEAPMDSGYMALHLDVDLMNIGELKSQRGYHGEVQILGADVEMLKDVEDLCYKLKKGKAIKSGDVAYEPFARIFNEAFNTGNKRKDKARMTAFNKYTKKAFETQRIRVPSNKMRDNVANWGYVYPTIEVCGFKDVLPPILDFNVLARIHRDCDDLYKVEHKTEKVLEEMTGQSEEKPTHKEYEKPQSTVETE